MDASDFFTFPANAVGKLLMYYVISVWIAHLWLFCGG